MEKITDKEALEVLNSLKAGNSEVATVFVKETVVYPVVIYYNKDIPSKEIRTFVRAGEYCSERQAQMAAELKKEYADLNKAYADGLKKKGINPVVKEYPLRATPMV